MSNKDIENKDIDDSVENDVTQKETVNEEQETTDVEVTDITEEKSDKTDTISDEAKEKSDKTDTISDETKKEETKPEKSETEVLQEKLTASTDKYLRLSAEFDNYRKRTLKERMELMKSAGEDIFLNILPVIDNFERALNSIKDAKDIEAVKEGINLIYTNFKEFMTQRGIKEIEAVGEAFDTDVHEAITKIPVQKKKEKGKVVDVIEKGYLLNDKVIRFAKVVIGE